MNLLLSVLWKLEGNAEISISGYSVISFDRNRHGGDITIYVRNNIVVNTLLYGPSDLVSFSVQLHLKVLYWFTISSP